MKKNFPLLLVLLLLILQSCTTKKSMLYLQDLDKYSNSTLNYAATKIQPNDILKIDISDAVMYLKIFRFLEMPYAIKELD